MTNVKRHDSNKLLFEEIAKKAKGKEYTVKIPNVSNQNKLLMSPYSNTSPKMRSPIIPKTPKTPSNKIATSPYQKSLQSPKTPNNRIATSPCILRSPYKVESPYSAKINPWIYNPTISERFTKIIGVDENGNLCKLPTIDYELPELKRYISEDNDGSDDYITIGDIFLDQKNSKGRDYNYVSQNMRNIALQTNNLRSLYANQFKPFNKNIKGKVNFDEYDELLEIYENNQVYYQDCIQHETMTYDQLCDALTELEYWFICIVEPYNYREYDEDEYDEWKTREQFKYNKGYSGYCDPELYFYIKQPLPLEIINYIKNSHKGLFKY